MSSEGLEEKIAFTELMLKLELKDTGYTVLRKEDVITLLNLKGNTIAAKIYPIQIAQEKIFFAEINGRENYHLEKSLYSITKPYKVLAMLNPDEKLIRP